MNGLAFLRRLLPSYARKRLERLTAAGLVLELRRDRPEGRVVRIDLGFGPELWAVAGAANTVARDPERLADARLLVFDGSPGEAVRKAADLSIAYEKVWVRF